MVRVEGPRVGLAAGAADTSRCVGPGLGENAMTIWSRVAVVVLLTLFSGSAIWIALAQSPQGPAVPQPLTLYRNGRIYTNDPSAPWAESILVRGEEILAVGDDDEVSALADKGAKIIDLQKRF